MLLSALWKYCKLKIVKCKLKIDDEAAATGNSTSPATAYRRGRDFSTQSL
jgi:hypothetical protein